MKNKKTTPLNLKLARWFALGAATLTASLTDLQPAQAALISKADNNSALNLGASWIGSVAPGSGDIAVWGSGVLVNTNDDALGAALSWSGIQVGSPGGPITIPLDANTLTLGASGINLAAASQSLTLSNNVAISVPQHWSIANGQTLNLEGALTRSIGAAILFNFDSNVASQAIIQTNTAGTIVTTNGTLLINNSLLANGTGAGIAFGTVNDIDFAALNSSGQIVPGNTIGGIYTTNPSGGTPTIGSLSGVYDVSNTNSIGVRNASTYYIDAMRFNTPQPNNSGANVFTYNGLGAWEVLFKSGTVMDLNALLITTNVGTAAVVFGAGGGMRIADAQNEFLVYQNNLAANLVFQSPVSQRSAGGIVSKLGAGTMEYQVACSYTGGTLLYGGTLLVDGPGNASTGPITVFNGANFEGQSGAAVNTAPIIVANGGTNSVWVIAANGQFKNGTNLTFNAGNTWMQFIYSNTVAPSTTTAPLTNLVLTASNTVNINVLYTSFTTGQYPLIKYGTLVTNSASSIFPFALTGIQPHVLGYITNNVVNNSIDLVVTNVDEPLSWAAAGGAWDVGLTANWKDLGGNSTTYGQAGPLGDDVQFTDAAPGSSPDVVTLNSSVNPGYVTVNNSALNYTISGSGSVNGTAVFTKTGSGTLVLATTNGFSGGLNLNGGILNFSTLNNLGAGVINFGGGTLQYNGNTDDISGRTVSLNSGGGAIDTAGQTVNYANPIGNSGVGGLTKTGSGTLTLNGINKYSGVTVVNQGTLALGASSYISNSSAIIVNSGAVLDTVTSSANLALSTGVGQILGGVGTIKGEVSAPLGTTITPATNGVVGTLSLANDLTVNGGTLAMDVSSSSADLISVTGNLTLTSGTLLLNVSGTLPNGTYRLMTYGGSLASGSGSSANLNLAGFSEVGHAATLSDATAGEIDLVVVTSASDNITWSGSSANTWDLAGTQDWLLGGVTPWAYTNGDIVQFTDSGSGSVSMMATVTPSSVVISNNSVAYDFEDGTGNGSGRIGGSTTLVKDGPGTAMLDIADSFAGATTIKNGVLQIGNGGIGDVGTGNITNNAALVFAQGDANTHYVAATISGTGSVTAQGTSPLIITKNNTYSGGTTISAGTLQVGNAGSTGSLGTGPVTNNASLLVNLTGTQTLTNNIAGSGPVAFIGSGTVTYGGTNTYANNTYISNGVVKVGSSSAIYSDGSAGDWLVLDGSATAAGTLDLNGHNLSVNALSGLLSTVNGLIENNGGTGTNTLAIVGSATTTYSGKIQDNSGTGGKVALLVGGAAVQTLDVETTAGNTFTGGTIVSNANLYFTTSTLIPNPVCLGTGPISLLGGALHAPGYGADNLVYYTSLANTINIPTNQTGAIYGPSRGTVAATITGSGTLFYNTTYVRGNFTGNMSAFTGQVYIGLTLTGGNLGIGTTSSFGRLFLTNNIGTSGPGTGVYLYNTVAGTPTVSIGELADDGSSTIESTSSGGGGGVAANFAVGSLNTSTTYGGNIIDNVGLVKVGTGTLTLTGATLTYSGQTTVSNGVLALGASSVPLNSTPITISSNGVLDVSAAGSLALGTQVLQGSGKLNGSISTVAATTILPGGTNSIGTLTVTNDVNLAGTVVMELNRTNTPATSDQIAAATVEAGGTLTVTNIGPDLHTGDTFHLFSVPVTGAFAVTNLPATTANGSITYVWTNNLALNGTIQVLVGVPSVNTNPVTANFKATSSGNALQFTWAPDHQGWQLYTNSVGLNTTNWFPVAGSSAVTNESITINPANPKVFFQLRYP